MVSERRSGQAAPHRADSLPRARRPALPRPGAEHRVAPRHVFLGGGHEPCRKNPGPAHAAEDLASRVARGRGHDGCARCLRVPRFATGVLRAGDSPRRGIRGHAGRRRRAGRGLDHDPAWSVVEGIVVDEYDRPVSSAGIWVGYRASEDAGALVTKTGTEGTFRLRSVSCTPSKVLAARAANSVSSPSLIVLAESRHDRQRPAEARVGQLRRPWARGGLK